MERATSSHETTNGMRGAIIGMHNAGIKASDIAKHLGVNARTVGRWIARYKKNGSLETKKRSGRPRATTKDQDNAIVNAILENSSVTSLEIYREMRPSCCKTTVLHRIKEAGFYCQKNQDRPSVFFSQQPPQRNISWTCDSIDVEDIKKEPELVEPLIKCENSNLDYTALKIGDDGKEGHYSKPFTKNIEKKVNTLRSPDCGLKGEFTEIYLECEAELGQERSALNVEGEINKIQYSKPFTDNEEKGINMRSGSKCVIKEEEFPVTFLECETKLEEVNESCSNKSDNLPTKQNSSKLNEEKIIYESLPFKCKICDCKFKQKFDLLSHAASVHNMIHMEDSECQNAKEKVKMKSSVLQGTKVYYCRLCSFNTVTKDQVEEHYVFNHKKDNEYLCTVCAQPFNNLGNLMQHISSVHEKKKAFQCGLCKYKCNHKGSLNRHMAGVHGKIF